MNGTRALSASFCFLLATTSASGQLQTQPQTQKDSPLFTALAPALQWFGFLSPRKSEQIHAGGARIGMIWVTSSVDGTPSLFNDEVGFRWPIACGAEQPLRVFAAKDGAVWQVPPKGSKASRVGTLPSSSPTIGLLGCREGSVAVVTQTGEVHLVGTTHEGSRLVGSVPLDDISKLIDASRTCNGATLMELHGSDRTEIAEVTRESRRYLSQKSESSEHWDPSYSTDCKQVLFIAPLDGGRRPRRIRQLEVPGPSGCTCRFAPSPLVPPLTAGGAVGILVLLRQRRRRLTDKVRRRLA